MLCPVPGVEIRALAPLAGEVAVPASVDPHIPVVVVDGFHGSAVGADQLHRILTRRSPVGRLGASAWLRGAGTVVRDAASAWQVPELPLDLNPIWRTEGGGTTCDRARRAFALWSR
jgi:hypothetical protein